MRQENEETILSSQENVPPSENSFISSIIEEMIGKAVSRDSKGPCCFLDLPDEIQELVLGYLSVSQIKEFKVNQHLEMISHQPSLWKEKFSIYFPEKFIVLCEEKEVNFEVELWKEIEIERKEFFEVSEKIYFLIKERESVEVIMRAAISEYILVKHRNELFFVLKLAVKSNHLKLVEKLVEIIESIYDESLNYPRDILCYLHSCCIGWAIEYDRENVFDFLMTRSERFIDVNAFLPGQGYILSYAIRMGRLEIVKKLLTQQAINLTQTGDILALAAQNNRPRIVEHLLELIVLGRLNDNNLDYEKALYFMVMYGHKELVKSLLSKNLHLNMAIEYIEYIEELGCRKTGNSLGAAVRSQDVEMVQLLLEKGADPNTQIMLHEKSPLSEAIESSQNKIYELFLQNEDHKRVFRNARYSYSCEILRTPVQPYRKIQGVGSFLHRALCQGGYKINEWLINEIKMDVEVKDTEGRLPLEVLLSAGPWKDENRRTELVKLILEKSTKDLDPKVIAAIVEGGGNKKIEYLKMILPRLAWINPRSDQETPALYYAMKDKEVFDYLVKELDADITQLGDKAPSLLIAAVDKIGKDLAPNEGWREGSWFDDLFLNPDMNISVQDSQGKTILHHLMYMYVDEIQPSLKVLTSLLNRDLNLISVKDLHGLTPLKTLRKSGLSYGGLFFKAHTDEVVRLLKYAEALKELIELTQQFQSYLEAKPVTNKIDQKKKIVCDLLGGLRNTDHSFEQRVLDFSRSLKENATALTPELFKKETAGKSLKKLGKAALFVLACATVLLGLGLAIGLAVKSYQTRGTPLFWRRRSSVYQDKANTLARHPRR